MSPAYLLAVDLDGTLVRGGEIATRDLDAVAAARRAGAAVTIATGRLAPTAVAIARSLGLDTPVLCADGAASVCPLRGVVVERLPLGERAVAAALAALDDAALAPFACLAGEIVAGRASLPLAPWLHGYAPSVGVRPQLDEALDGRADEVVMVLGLGPFEAVSAARSALEAALSGEVAVAAFGLGDGAPWAVRLLPRGADKGAGLARLAARLGVPRARVAAVGDGYNDIGMLAWAGRSYAMAGSPAPVRAAAREVLPAEGGVAEAVARWFHGAAEGP